MRRPLVLIGLAAFALGPGMARADWEVRRAPDDARVTNALLDALLARPDDRGALSRLLAHAAGKSGIGKLAEGCDARARDAQRLACGHLHREAGRPELALARYAALGDDARARRAEAELLLRLGRADEALRSLEPARAQLGAATPRPVLELLLTATAQARTPGLEVRRKLAEGLADELLAGAPGDSALARRVVDALSLLGANARAARVISSLATRTGDPRARAPLLFRAAELLAAGDQLDEALAALDQALALSPPGDGRRREAQERVVSIERKRDRLAELASRWSAWPEAKRDAATEELLGRIRDELGDTAAAQRHLVRAVRLDPRALGPRRLLIRLHTRAGDEEAAIAELRRLAVAVGDDPRVALELAERLFARPGGGKEARVIAERVGRRHRDSTTHAALAALYQKWGDKDRALAEASLLVRLEPEEPEHIIALGELHDQRGDKELALKTWRRLAAGANPPLQQLLRLADVLAEHDAAGEALSLLERAAHAHPADATVERRLADVLDRLKRDTEAEAIYRRILEQAVARDDAALVREVGGRWLELAVRRGTLTAALSGFASSTEDPRTAARFELALLVVRGRVREKRGVEAERLLRKLGTAAPRAQDRARALEALAELLGARTGPRAAEVLELLVSAAELDPTRAPLLYGKASERASELYRDEDSLRYAERAVALGALDADSHERLGGLLEPRDPVRALSAFDRALELDGSRDRLRLRAAELALRQGDDAGAAARYRTLLARARDEQAIDDAARRAVVVHELTGRLGALEREIAPRATAGDGPAALRRLLVDIERRYVPQLAARADAGDETARLELARVAGHALAPLLDAVVEGDRDERRTAVVLLGQLGAAGAAPLLLRLAAGEAMRRGGEAPPIELRVAAADAAAWLVTEEHLPRLLPLTSDPEQRIRAAATLGLARLARGTVRGKGVRERILAALHPRVSDEHDRVAAIACLGLGALPASAATWSAASASTTEPGRPLAARACGLALAEHLEHAAAGDADSVTLARRLATVSAEAPPLTAGLARALLAGEDPAALERALVAVLGNPVLSRTLGAVEGSARQAALRSGSGALDLLASIAAREGLGPTTLSARQRGLVRDAILRLLDGSATELVLADLASPRALLPRILAVRAPGREGDASQLARAELLDAATPKLVAVLAPAKGTPAIRALAIGLLVERPGGLGPVAEALARPSDRRAALAALGSASAALVPADLIERLAAPMRSALGSTDWRDRRSALVATQRHPALAAALAPEVTALRSDANHLVAELARRAPPPGPRVPPAMH